MSVLANIVLILFIIAGILWGLREGFLRTAAALVGLLVIPRVTLLILRTLPLPKEFFDSGGAPVSVIGLLIFFMVFLVLLAAVLVLVRFIDQPLQRALPRPIRLGVYRPLGAAVGGFAFFLIFGLLFSSVSGLASADAAVLGSMAARASSGSMAMMGLPSFQQVSWDNILPKQAESTPETTTTLEFPATQGQLTLETGLEQRMVDMVNAERTSRGLKALRVDATLTEMARAHSLDMVQRRYFSHYTPEGRSVADRADAAGLAYRIVGENLALAPDLQSAHDGLMASQGHRENILRPDFTRIGIGIYREEGLGLVITQNFAD